MDGENDVIMTDTVAGPSKSVPSVPLHRVRFVDWAPSSVSALAFLPLTKQVQSASSAARSILAVGRENGNIDLCVWVEDDGIDASKLNDSHHASASVAKGWVVDTTLVGTNPSKVDSLVFVLSPTVPYATPRLFSSSGGAIVTEHYLPPHLIMSSRAPNSSAQFQQLPAVIRKDSTLSNVSRSIPSQGGSVWSMAASPLGKHLAIGCEDGIVRMIDIADGRFELASYSRSSLRGSDGVVRGNISQLDRAKARIVSLAWGPPQRREKTKKAPFVPIGGKKKQNDSDSDSSDSDSDDDDDDDEWDDSFVLGGTAQSLAYVWSANTGRVITKLVVDRSRNQQTIVWSCATLLDGTCVLGDSMGQVSFYDGKMFTLLPGARFTSHGKGADVLSLCVGSDGQCVYSASVDQKVVEYARVGVAKQTKWMISGKRRLHAHDIRALAIDPPFNPKSLLSSSDGYINRLPILVSAGVDFHLTLTPAASPSRANIIDTIHPKQQQKQSGSKEQEEAQKANRIPKQSRFDHINPVSSTPITTFADTIHRRLPFVPTTGKGSALGGGSVIRICTLKRWVILRREKSVAIWKLPLQASEEDEDDSKKVEWKIVLEMQIRVQSNLVCAEISQDGRFLFVSDLYESKLFELHEDGKDIIPKRVKSFSTKTFASQGVQQGPASSAATFTPDNARLVLASYPGAFVHVVDLPRSTDSSKCTLLKSFAEHRQAAFGRSVAGKAVRMANGNGQVNGGHISEADSDLSDEESEEISAEDKNQSASEPRTTFARIDTIEVSSDGQYLVSIDAAKRIHSYSLDTLHHRGALPSPAHQPNAVTFDPWRPHMMCCVLPTNQTVVYDLERRQANFAGNTPKPASSTTSKELGKKALKAEHRMRHRGEEGFIAALNEELTGVRDNAIGLFWLSPTVLAVWGATFLCTAKRIQITPDEQSTNVPRNGKRAHPDESSVDLINAGEQSDHYWRARLVTKYQPLLYAGTVPGSTSSETELVVVERPYYDVASSLPPTYFSGASYGT